MTFRRSPHPCGAGDGRWHDVWYDTASRAGRFVRHQAVSRNWVTADGSSGFPAASVRHHLYVSFACPWARRTLVFRKLKELEDHVSVSVVRPLMRENGRTFQDDEGVVRDTVNGAEHLCQVSTVTRPEHTGRATVPVL